MQRRDLGEEDEGGVGKYVIGEHEAAPAAGGAEGHQYRHAGGDEPYNERGEHEAPQKPIHGG